MSDNTFFFPLPEKSRLLFYSAAMPSTSSIIRAPTFLFACARVIPTLLFLINLRVTTPLHEDVNYRHRFQRITRYEVDLLIMPMLPATEATGLFGMANREWLSQLVKQYKKVGFLWLRFKPVST